tara:strand:+ start:3050 stop:3301 length:252 start_codon:yes stop_codon:yes gene_type:complete
MTSEIGRRRYDIDRREREARQELLKDHNEKFSAEYAKLKEDCAKSGHVMGRVWDNGLGWDWKICAYCGAGYDHHSYLPEASDE